MLSNDFERNLDQVLYCACICTEENCCSIRIFHTSAHFHFFFFLSIRIILWEEIIAKTVITLAKVDEATIRSEVEVGVRTVQKITAAVGPVGETVPVTIATEVVIVSNLGMIATAVLDGAGVGEAATAKPLFTTRPARQPLNRRPTFPKQEATSFYDS